MFTLVQVTFLELGDRPPLEHRAVVRRSKSLGRLTEHRLPDGLYEVRDAGGDVLHEFAIEESRVLI